MRRFKLILRGRVVAEGVMFPGGIIAYAGELGATFRSSLEDLAATHPGIDISWVDR